MDFIFKGGTSLVLLMDKPLRFSVDIDIIIGPSITRDVLEEYLSKIAVSSEFIRMELDERRSYKGGIPKAHYLAALLLTGSKDKPEIFDAAIAAREDLVAHPEYNFLNKRLKFVAEGEALFYWRRIIKRLYPE